MCLLEPFSACTIAGNGVAYKELGWALYLKNIKLYAIKGMDIVKAADNS